MSVIETPYFKPIIPTVYNESTNLPTLNYTPYDLFKIKTKTFNKIIDYIGSDVNIMFTSEFKDSKMLIVIRLEKISINSPQILLTQEQYNTIKSWVDDSISYYPDHVLITYDGINKSIYDEPVSNTWIKSVIPYVKIPIEYNPFILDEGIYVMLDEDYDVKYQNIVMSIIDQLKYFYNNGYITGAKNIADAWNLYIADYDEEIPNLYYAPWKDYRFAPNIINFLTQRLTGDDVISMKIDHNDVIRHNIAFYALKNNVQFYFSHDSINFKSSSYQETQKIISSIYDTHLSGLIIKFRLSRPSLLKVYQKALQDIYNDSNFIWYATDNPSRPIIVSCLFDINVSIDSERLKINKQVFNILSNEKEQLEPLVTEFPLFIPYNLPKIPKIERKKPTLPIDVA